MISTQTRHGVDRLQREASNKLEFFVHLGKRLGLLRVGATKFDDFGKGNEFLENFREEFVHRNGQYLSLDLQHDEEKGFAEILLEELESAHDDDPLRINLPLTVSKSPFFRRAIAWQRLCDRLVEDEEPGRPTLLVLEHFDEADERTQQDVERLIRFHITYNIRRTFLLTLRDETSEISPSLLRLVELRIEI